MTDSFHLDIVSPEGKIFSGAVAKAFLPGSEGRFGLLPKHAPFLSSLGPGIIEISASDAKKNEVHRHFITSGFVEISDDKCTILVDAATPYEALKEEEIRQSIQNLKEDVADSKTSDEKQKSQKMLSLEEVKLREFIFASQK